MHRNVANLVVHSDLNCLSVIQYAVDVLKCRTSSSRSIRLWWHRGGHGLASMGLIDNWLRHVQDIRDRHPELLAITWPRRRWTGCASSMCWSRPLNVCRTTVVRDAWNRGQSVAVHGLIYSVADVLLRDLNFCATRRSGQHGACSIWRWGGWCAERSSRWPQGAAGSAAVATRPSARGQTAA